MLKEFLYKKIPGPNIPFLLVIIIILFLFSMITDFLFFEMNGPIFKFFQYLIFPFLTFPFLSIFLIIGAILMISGSILFKNKDESGKVSSKKSKILFIFGAIFFAAPINFTYFLLLALSPLTGKPSDTYSLLFFSPGLVFFGVIFYIIKKNFGSASISSTIIGMIIFSIFYTILVTRL